MSYTTSSMLGVDLNNASTTQLFTLNQRVIGNDSTEWQYVIATAALTTGMMVSINTAGTANIFSTAILNGGGAVGTTGDLDIGFAQFSIAAGSYGFVAKKGFNLYVLCSSTIIPGTGVAFHPTTGALIPMANVAAGQTAAGIFVTNTAASTGTLAVATAIVTFPRPLSAGATLNP